MVATSTSTSPGARFQSAGGGTAEAVPGYTAGIRASPVTRFLYTHLGGAGPHDNFCRRATGG